MDQQPTHEAVRRLAKDVRALSGNSLAEHGIFYAHSESCILNGEAIILGPPGTPYENGIYTFRLRFPLDYPHAPPKVTFITQDQRGNMRFNPNLYRVGTVCLSILNTWQGPQWTGCQSISSVLLSIRTAVLNAEPLLNEPGVTRAHPDFKSYHKLLKFKNLETAFFDTVSGKVGPASHILRDKIMEICSNNLEAVDNIIQDELDMSSLKQSIRTDLYRIEGRVNYVRLRDWVRQFREQQGIKSNDTECMKLK